MNFETIKTKRLVLRLVNQNVCNFVYNTYTDKAIIDFFGFKKRQDLLIEKNKFIKGLSTFNKSFAYFQLIESSSKQVIGWCGFHTWYLDHNRAEIGYGIFSDKHKNQGYMTEAMGKIIKYGFEEMKLHRIEAFISPNNKPSVKLINRFNFIEEGLLREHYQYRGKMEDSKVFSLLKNEF